MNLKLSINYLGKIESKSNTDKDMYFVSFKTYNAEISGRFEKSEIRHIIEQLDNSII
tara:strand:- start:95 stop:265 length:171 start_codon:yes stop_codon:yes gene_type:complete